MSLFGKYDLILAPMAGLTDCSTRTICTSLGADLAFSEMVSTKGLEYNSQKTKDLFKLGPSEEKIGVQIFGSDASIMAHQASMIEDTLQEHLAYIDINMGCPAKKIVSKGDGAALIKDPKGAWKIVSQVKSSINVPLGVKTRRGYKLGDETCTEFAKILEDAGADLICIHGRYAEQYYRGTSDKSCIRRVKKSVSIPVVGNGDVKSVGDYIDMKEQTGCDCVMIGRAAISNPLIFSQIKQYVNTGQYSLYSAKERMDIAIKHARLICEIEPKRSDDMSFFRRHAMCYVEGLRGAKIARKKICESMKLNDFIQIFNEIAKANENAA